MDKKWYVVNTYSGHEKKVQEKLLMRASSMNMEDYIFRVIVPEQTEVEVKDGVTKEKVKKLFPGYVLVEMVRVLNLHLYNHMKLIRYLIIWV